MVYVFLLDLCMGLCFRVCCSCHTVSSLGLFCDVPVRMYHHVCSIRLRNDPVRMRRLKLLLL